MENKRWIDILVETKKLDTDFEITMLNQNPEFYLLEGISKENSIDEMLLVYDCSNLGDEDAFYYEHLNKINEEHCDAQPVIIFKNWEQERRIYSRYYELIKGASRKRFSDWYDSKISIYIESADKVILETDNDGINYLEYPCEENINKVLLKGRIYNVSFFELKKLFNVTGNHLFVKNVRYGLKGNKTAKDLKVKFGEYLSIAIFKKLIELKYEGNVLEELKEILNIDEAVSLFLSAEDTGNIEYDYERYMPENFWFYHNGITIFSYDKILETPANQIILYPQNVSVINGAQTMTNFFLEAESIEKKLSLFWEKNSIPKKKIIEEIIKTIYVKTIIVNGSDKFVRPITHGLNTQIPVFEESLLADSKLSEEINVYLAKESKPSNRIRILKDGEAWNGENGLNVLSFVKHWLIIKKTPGKSKNLAKRQLPELMQSIKESLEKETSIVEKYGQLKQIYEWWDLTKLQRNEEDEDEINRIVGKYGRNYFASYVLNAKIDELIDENSLAILYESFIKDINIANRKNGIEINVGTFKKDELSKFIFELQEDRAKKKDSSETIFPEDIEGELLLRLNLEGQSAYSFARAITNYLLEKEITIDYFRVISRTGKKCREAFAFPNSTFNEIIDLFDVEDKNEEMEKVINFDESMFFKAVHRNFPVFVIDKDNENSRNAVSKVHFIEKFSFENYEEEAKKVFDKTVEAFKEGEENKFPKSSDQLKFHVRPKAANSEDTFQFTNGDFITKRTFWANKNIVESILEKALAEKRQV